MAENGGPRRLGLCAASAVAMPYQGVEA